MIVIIIPAKGGSNRLPNKNMAPVNGRPMIDYSIDEARRSTRGGTVYISTDSDEIAAHAATRGVPVIRRGEDLAGEAPIIDVYRHALAAIGDPGIEVIVGLQPDHPDRNVTIDDALSEYEKCGADHLVSTEADGTKNGSHYIMSRHFLDTGASRKTVSIVDDCTNIHYPQDLERAAIRLKARSKGQ